MNRDAAEQAWQRLLDLVEAELRDAEARFQREADRRAAAEAAVADLEGKLTLAEEELSELRSSDSDPSRVTAHPAPDELPELPAGWHWATTYGRATADFLVNPRGRVLGSVKHEQKPGWQREWWVWSQIGGGPHRGALPTRYAAGLALLDAAELEHGERLSQKETRIAETRAAAAAIRDAGGIEPVRLGSVPAGADLASPRASAALAQPPFSKTDVQAGSSVQYGAVSHAEAPATRVETQQLDVRPPCTAVQGAFPVRASRRLSARSRCARSSRLSAGESKGTVGLSARVAKGAPSLTGSNEAEKTPSSPGLGKPACIDGALTSGPGQPETGSEKPSRRSLLCDPGGELRIAVSLLGPVALVWWLAVKLAWLCGVLGEREPGIRWLGIGWHRVDGVESGALPTYWLGFAPPGAGAMWTDDQWTWRDHPHGPPLPTHERFTIHAVPGAVVVFREGVTGRAHWVNTWGAWRTVLDTEERDEPQETTNLLRALRDAIAEAERACPDCALRGDCHNRCEAERAAAESPDEIAALAAELTPGIVAGILEYNRAAAVRMATEPLTDREREALAGRFRGTPEPGARAEALAHVIACTARMCDQSAAAVRLGGAGPTELAAERLNEVARILRDGLAAADASAPEPSADLDLLGSRAEAQAAERALDYPRVALLAAELERVVRDAIKDLRDCGVALYGTDAFADDLEAKLHNAQHPAQPPADTAAERGE